MCVFVYNVPSVDHAWGCEKIKSVNVLCRKQLLVLTTCVEFHQLIHLTYTKQFIINLLFIF
jgi:hypothetical protein